MHHGIAAEDIERVCRDGHDGLARPLGRTTDASMRDTHLMVARCPQRLNHGLFFKRSPVQDLAHLEQVAIRCGHVVTDMQDETGDELLGPV